MAIYTSNYSNNEIDKGVGLGLSSPLNIYKSIVAAICASSIDGFTVTETTNAEWNYVLTDSEDRIIAGVKTDGSLYIADIDSRGTLGSYTIAQIDAAIGSISGKQDVIDAQHKLSADLVDDSTTTNKFTNATEKQAWNGKQDALVSGTNIKTINNESILGGGNINIQGDPNIIAPVNSTDATLPITTLTCEVGKYYRIDVAVDTLAVTLPAMTDLTTVRTVIIYLTAGTTPAVTISAADSKDVCYQDGYAIEAGNTYEINALWNGLAWIVASVEIVTNNGE